MSIFFPFLGSGGGPPSDSVGTSGNVATTAEEEKVVDFVGAVMDDTQTTWQQLLGRRYQPTKVRLFRDAIESACGFAQSASGPFYCPGDHYVYLDLGFFNELRRKFRAARMISRRRTSSPTKSATTSRICSASTRKCGDCSRRIPGQRTSYRYDFDSQADCLAGV